MDYMIGDCTIISYTACLYSPSCFLTASTISLVSFAVLFCFLTELCNYLKVHHGLLFFTAVYIAFLKKNSRPDFFALIFIVIDIFNDS